MNMCFGHIYIISLLQIASILTDCPPLGSHFGGQWHCFPPVDDVQDPVADDTICVLQCYQDKNCNEENSKRWLTA